MVPKPAAHMTRDDYVCLKTRTVYLDGEVDGNMVWKTIRSLAILEGSDQVQMYLDSDGGYVHEAWAIIDALHRSPIEVDIIGTGQVCSAAADVIIFGPKHHRWATPNTVFMMHPPSFELPEAESDKQKSRTDWEASATKAYLRRLARVLGKKVSTVEKLIANDWYFNAKDALKHNIIDDVWR